MRIGIIGQPCIDEIIHVTHPSAVPEQALGGVLYSYAAMERLMREGGSANDSFVPLTWLSNPDRSFLESLLDKFRHLEHSTGLWPTAFQTNRVQLVYRENGERTEHCPHILPALNLDELSVDVMDSLDGLFVNMISGYDVSIDTLETALNRTAKRPYVHIDIHALVLGHLSEQDDNASFGGGREPLGVKEWKRWLAIADSAQLNELEVRWFADPDVQSEAELLRYILLSNQFPKLRYLILTRAERGATLFDFESEMVFNATPPAVEAIETTGSGDVFGSAFVFSVLSGKRPEEALQNAVEWASWNTTLKNIGQILEAPLFIS
jgi:sugar/nucleoside kinase (ribokinase family)